MGVWRRSAAGERTQMSNKAKIREESVKMNPIHDVMFTMMARDPGFCQEILRVILNDPALELIGDPVVQYHLPNPMGRKVTLDALCKLGDGRTVAIEVQKNTEPDPQRRVRFESGLLISRLTDPNTPFKDVEDVVFVYISGYDPFDLGKSVYFIDRIVRGLGNVVYNGFEEVYVNAAVKDGTDVAALMKVFTEDAAYDDRFPRTSERLQSQEDLRFTALRGLITEQDFTTLIFRRIRSLIMSGGMISLAESA